MTPEQFREAREKLGLTQTQLAARWGKDRKTIYRWEKGIIKIDPLAADCIALLLKDRG